MPIDAELARQVQGQAGPDDNQYAGGAVATVAARAVAARYQQARAAEQALRFAAPWTLAAARIRVDQIRDAEADALAHAALDDYEHQRAVATMQAAQHASQQAESTRRAAQAQFVTANADRGRVEAQYQAHLTQQATNRTSLGTAGWNVAVI